MCCSEELWTAICQLEVSLCCTPCAFIQLHSGRAFNGGRRSSREEIISRQQWDSWYTQTRYTSVSGLGPVLSVKASVIVKGPAGLEGLVVRATNPCPLQQRLKLWQEGRVRWAHMWSWWFISFMYRKIYCLLDTLYMQKYHPAGTVFQKLLLCFTRRGYCRIYQGSRICVQFLVISFTHSPPFSHAYTSCYFCFSLSKFFTAFG